MKHAYLKLAAAPAALWLMATPVFAQARTSDSDRVFGYHHGPGMMWGGDHWGGYGTMFGPLFSLLVLLAIVALVIYLLRIFGFMPNAPHSGRSGGSALDILKERYARGEIDSKEFDERKRLLSD